MSEMHVRRDDTVLVIKGRERGKQGKISRVIPKEGRVVVAGINLVKRHMKASAGRQAGIIEKAMPLDASNVMVVCTECGQPTRIAHERVPMGADQKLRTRRVCKKCGKAITEHTREA